MEPTPEPDEPIDYGYGPEQYSWRSYDLDPIKYWPERHAWEWNAGGALVEEVDWSQIRDKIDVVTTTASVYTHFYVDVQVTVMKDNGESFDTSFKTATQDREVPGWPITLIQDFRSRVADLVTWNQEYDAVIVNAVRIVGKKIDPQL
jgi:hypothetical protein